MCLEHRETPKGEWESQGRLVSIQKRSGNWLIYCTRKVIIILGGGNGIVFEHAGHS